MQKRYIVEAFEPERARQLVRRIEFCYTPKHGSWLNVAENELSAMTRQCVDGRRFGDVETLQGEIAAWSTDINNTQRSVDWHMKVEDARHKLISVYPKIKS
jgi:DDE superfamily endonuclease